MKQIDCFWYVGESLRPWEMTVVGTLSRALIKSGTSIRSFSEGGTENLSIPGLISWHSLNAIERFMIVGTKGRLWHLWGTPPSWWKIVRIRARTVHTRFDNLTGWKGHPTVLSATVCSSGETYIPPAFEIKVNWGEDIEKGPSFEEEAPVCLVAGKSLKDYSHLLEEMNVILCSLEENMEISMKFLGSGRSVLLVPEPTPSVALLSAYGALMGVPTAAPRSVLMDELLGKDGYVCLPPRGNVEETRDALGFLLGEGGRSASAIARRHAVVTFPPEKGAKKLEHLYSSLSGGVL